MEKFLIAAFQLCTVLYLEVSYVWLNSAIKPHLNVFFCQGVISPLLPKYFPELVSSEFRFHMAFLVVEILN